jgi:hypothetical protein
MQEIQDFGSPVLVAMSVVNVNFCIFIRWDPKANSVVVHKASFASQLPCGSLTFFCIRVGWNRHVQRRWRNFLGLLHGG